MANEDLLPQIFAEIYNKANVAPPSDNQQINKIEIPNDQMTLGVNAQTWVGGTNLSNNLSDTMTISQTVTVAAVDPTTQWWGGLDANGNLQYAGWDWGVGGQWN